MGTIAIVLFAVSLVALVSAAACALRGWTKSDPGLYQIARRTTEAGAVFMIATILVRWSQLGRPPLTGSFDVINVFILMTVCVVIATQFTTPHRILSAFYLPPVAGIAALNVVLALRSLSETPRELESIFLLFHVGMVFLAYAFFFVASLTSIAYLVQVRHLKIASATAQPNRLPPLEQLDTLLYRLIATGYPLFVVTLILGVCWAWFGQDKDKLGAQWWLSPKIIMSVFTVVLYAVSFHARRMGVLRGPKLAYLVILGFNAFLVVYLLLTVLGLSGYKFWGQTQ
jgi:ABC-type transport system involved in cytochrome c biogenesis permease subunit